MLYCDSTSRVPPVPGTHSAACRSPPPDRSIVAPALSATLPPLALMNFAGGAVRSGDAPRPAVGLNCHSTPSTVVPYGMIVPSFDTDVRLPLANVTELVATAGGLPSVVTGSTFAAVGSPTPKIRLPE